MGTLVAIDPGNVAGIACFEDETLQWARILEKPLGCGIQGTADRVVVEVPRIYPGGRANPATLIYLATVAGYLAGCWDTSKVRLVHPQEWKGQRDKEVDNRYTLSLLSDQERRIVLETTKSKTKLHNVIDAVGIGLWELGRR